VRYADVLVGHVAPFQASGSLKPTTTDSDLSGPAVSSENRRKSSDMFGPLIDKLRCPTQNALVTNTLLAGEHPYKTPIFL